MVSFTIPAACMHKANEFWHRKKGAEAPPKINEMILVSDKREQVAFTPFAEKVKFRVRDPLLCLNQLDQIT